MNSARSLWWTVAAVAGCIAFQWSNPQDVLAQEKKPAQAEAKKEPAKPRGRLPAYYGDVVSKEQREKIYSIQQSYEEKMAALEEQLREMQLQMATEIAGVLTPEQVKKVEEISAAARIKSKAAAAAKAALKETPPEEAKAPAEAAKTPAEAPKAVTPPKKAAP